MWDWSAQIRCAPESDVGKSCMIEIIFYCNLNLRLRSPPVKQTPKPCNSIRRKLQILYHLSFFLFFLLDPSDQIRIIPFKKRWVTVIILQASSKFPVIAFYIEYNRWQLEINVILFYGLFYILRKSCCLLSYYK